MSENLICGLPARLFAYIAATTAVAAPLIVLSLVKIAIDPPTIGKAASVALFFALAALADLQPMPMGEGGKTDVSITTVFIVTAAILFGWHYAVPAAALSIAITMVVTRRPIERVAFNVASYSIFAFAASAPVIIFGSSDTVGAGRLTGYILGGAALHVLSNVVIVAGVVAISQRRPLPRRLPAPRSGATALSS